jgi:hypothetical protein
MKNVTVMINIHKDVSTVQLKYGDEYIVENSQWTYGKEKFPFKAFLKAIDRILYKLYKRKIQILRNKINQSVTN